MTFHHIFLQTFYCSSFDSFVSITSNIFFSWLFPYFFLCMAHFEWNILCPKACYFLCINPRTFCKRSTRFFLPLHILLFQITFRNVDGKIIQIFIYLFPYRLQNPADRELIRFSYMIKIKKRGGEREKGHKLIRNDRVWPWADGAVALIRDDIPGSHFFKFQICRHKTEKRIR